MSAKQMGATFSLLLMLGAIVGMVWSVVGKMPVIMPACCGTGAVIAGVMVKSDWTTVWKPLLGIK